MSMLLEMHFKLGLLSVEAKGTFSLQEAKRTFLEMIEAVIKYKSEKILFDGRDLKGNPKDMERFYYGEFAAKETMRLTREHRIAHAPRFAYLLKEPIRDPKKFGENVAVNRGMIVKTFETQEEAFEWLMHVKPKSRMQAKLKKRI